MKMRFENHDLETEGCGQFIDVTDDVAVVERSEVRQGMAVVYSPHTDVRGGDQRARERVHRGFPGRCSTHRPERGIYYRHDDLSVRTEGLEGDPH